MYLAKYILLPLLLLLCIMTGEQILQINSNLVKLNAQNTMVRNAK